MSHKSKGINAERELIHKFWASRWAASRVAGSGSTKYPSPDIIAGNNLRKIVLEVKVTKDDKKYFPKKEIEELIEYANLFGAEPWIAIKFYRTEWRFYTLEDLTETNASFVIAKDEEHKAISFEELIR